MVTPILLATLPAAVEPLRIDPSGTIRVGKSRITLELLVEAFRSGDSPEQIAVNFESLTRADIYGAIGYYLRHRETFDPYLTNCQAESESLLRDVEAANDIGELRKRLLSRQSSCAAA